MKFNRRAATVEVGIVDVEVNPPFLPARFVAVEDGGESRHLTLRQLLAGYEPADGAAARWLATVRPRVEQQMFFQPGPPPPPAPRLTRPRNPNIRVVKPPKT